MRYRRVRSRSLVFEGQFENSVLGRFRIIRGFANLKDLAAVSVPYEMQDAATPGQVEGQQRKIDPKHAARIKNYLENGDQQFLPEVILSVRANYEIKTNYLAQEVGVNCNVENKLFIFKRWNSDYHKIHLVRIHPAHIGWVRDNKLIRRIDGNHRLDQAAALKDDPRSLTKYLAPFCLILLGPPGDVADDYSESLIFHTINSTALPLESEHALRLILGQKKGVGMEANREFAFNPDLHFTRLLHEGLLKLSKPAQERLGDRPLTCLDSAARSLRELEPKIAESLPALQKYAGEFLAALDDIVTRLEPREPSLCKAEYFIELVARVWKGTPEDQSHNVRVNAAVLHLEELATWLGRDGLTSLKEGQSISSQVLELFNSVRTRIPKRVFLARWYPTEAEGNELKKANLRLDQVKQSLKDLKEAGINLQLVDMASRKGGTFPIHDEMYKAIVSSDIILIDLSGARPNVCVEAGFALKHHAENRLIFIFQPTEPQKNVPFDLGGTYCYIPFEDAAEIPSKLKPHIEAIVRCASVGGN